MYTVIHPWGLDFDSLCYSNIPHHPKIQITPTSIAPKLPKPGFGDFGTMPLRILSKFFHTKPELFNFAYNPIKTHERLPCTDIYSASPCLSLYQYQPKPPSPASATPAPLAPTNPVTTASQSNPPKTKSSSKNLAANAPQGFTLQAHTASGFPALTGRRSPGKTMGSALLDSISLVGIV